METQKQQQLMVMLIIGKDKQIERKIVNIYLLIILTWVCLSGMKKCY